MKNTFFYSDKIILAAVIALLLISNLMIISTWGVQATVYGNSSNLTIIVKQGIFIFLGLIIYVISSKINSSFYRKNSKLFFVVTIILLIIVLSGDEINESKSWIDLKFFSLQPSEVAKLAIILSIASYFDKIITTKKFRSNQILKQLLFYIVLPVFLIILQPDPGTAIIILVLAFVLFMGSRLPKKIIVNIIIKLSCLILIFVLGFGVLNIASGGKIASGFKNSQSRAISRFENYDKPCNDFRGKGFQICNALIAINLGGFSGVGLGNSTQKYTYLPESHTDVIIAVTAEELGLRMILVIILMYMIIVFRIMHYAKNIDGIFESLFCLGAATLFAVQFFINVGGVTTLIPFTGIPLPFFSKGGSFLLVSFLIIGIVQSIASEYNREKIIR